MSFLSEYEIAKAEIEADILTQQAKYDELYAAIKEREAPWAHDPYNDADADDFVLGVQFIAERCTPLDFTKEKFASLVAAVVVRDAMCHEDGFMILASLHTLHGVLQEHASAFPPEYLIAAELEAVRALSREIDSWNHRR